MHVPRIVNRRLLARNRLAADAGKVCRILLSAGFCGGEYVRFVKGENFAVVMFFPAFGKQRVEFNW